MKKRISYIIFTLLSLFVCIVLAGAVIGESMKIYNANRLYGVISLTGTALYFFLVCFFAKHCKHIRLCTAAIPVLAFLARLLVIHFWKIPPKSDFLVTYKISAKFADTYISQWYSIADLLGVYATRWSAHTPFILYQTAVMKIFGTSCLALQIANCAVSALTVFFSMCICGKLWGKSSALICGGAMMLMPTALLFVPILCNQHISSMFFMLSLCIFICRPIKNIYANTAVSAAAMGFAHLMRPEMYVMIIASLCILIYSALCGEKPVLKGIAMFSVFSVTFFAVLYIVDIALLSSQLTRQTIFSGNLGYKILVGLNTQYNGMWNEADARLLLNSEEIAIRLCERISAVLKQPKFIADKLACQFGKYHYDWSVLADTDTQKFISYKIYPMLTQAFMLFVTAAASVRLIFEKEKSVDMFVLLITLTGYIITFALIEIQPRYNYFLIPVIIILASLNFNKSDIKR